MWTARLPTLALAAGFPKKETRRGAKSPAAGGSGLGCGGGRERKRCSGRREQRSRGWPRASSPALWDHGYSTGAHPRRRGTDGGNTILRSRVEHPGLPRTPTIIRLSPPFRSDGSDCLGLPAADPSPELGSPNVESGSPLSHLTFLNFEALSCKRSLPPLIVHTQNFVPRSGTPDWAPPPIF